ncbi:MAG TPA: LON peptidase substrate-binding domain-containing protein, partial [Methylomirabilota bacterium]|nr:LON peptidase substrate-binding domain-containing protein [Methylomirabilota bacterium]
MATQVALPIFPLPDLAFFPHTMLPLHVFEARYRAMVTDCLARDKRLAVVGLKPGYEAGYEGKPPVYPITGVGRIVQWERLATGRFNLLLRGECRARIDRELPTDTLYRMVAATPLEETGAARAGV